jgi:vancomycin resistance protein YoaR
MKPIFGAGVVYDAPDWKFQNFRKYPFFISTLSLSFAFKPSIIP